VTRFQAAFTEALADIEERGGRALLVGGTGLYLRAAVDGFTVPPQFPDVRAELEREPDTAALHARLAQLDPAGASRMEPTNRRRMWFRRDPRIRWLGVADNPVALLPALLGDWARCPS